MDFMKVIDQTVREIKREVNLKVLKVPEIEQKVLDATDDEPWGPHGTALAEIAQATKKFSECQMVMNALWTRLGETGHNWRHVYKALAVIEYLVSNGSERAVDDIIEHTFQISSFSSFEHVEPSGKDNGINVRKKVETIVALLNDKDKIQEARNKAAANRDKYFGLSSAGLTYKSGSSTSSGSSFQSSDHYGGFGGAKDDDTFRDSFKEKDRTSDDKFDQITSRSRRGVTGGKPDHTSKKGSSSRYSSKDQDSSADESKLTAKTASSDQPAANSSVPSSSEDDFDDFNPRGTPNTKAAAERSSQVNIFGQNLVGNLLDEPVDAPTEKSTVISPSEEVDLFADATFVSAPSHVDKGVKSGPEVKIDLFASKIVPSSTASPAVDIFAAPDPVLQPGNNSSQAESTAANVVDPFAAIPVNNFDGSDFFAAFTDNTSSASTDATRNSVDNVSHNQLNDKPPSASNLPPKKDAFQVKSGIWADSLSRGLIDLNISAPKKVNLTDVGIVGGLTDGFDRKEKGPPTSFYSGKAMGTGSGLGKSTVDMDDFFSSLSNPQSQFGGFQK